jgi:hypothetical protein
MPIDATNPQPPAIRIKTIDFARIGLPFRCWEISSARLTTQGFPYRLKSAGLARGFRNG